MPLKRQKIKPQATAFENACLVCIKTLKVLAPFLRPDTVQHQLAFLKLCAIFTNQNEI